MSSAMLVPVAGGERVQTLDVLRGFALFGILLVNFEGAGMTGVPDRVANFFLMFFVSGKFYPLYSFLFGVGFGVMLLRATARGSSIVPLYVRRLLVLGLIGALHFIFLWAGDILHMYAYLGLVLLLFRNRSPRFLLIAAVAALLVSSYWGHISVDQPPQLTRAEPELQLAQAMERATSMDERLQRFQVMAWAQSDGTYVDLVVARARSFARPQFSLWTMDVLGMFLLGLYAAKRRLFENVRAHRKLALRVLAAGAAFALAGNFMAVAAPELAARGIDLEPAWWPRVERLVWTLSGPAFSVTYVAALALLYEGARARRWLAILAPAGRMGLTNYLLQSVVGTSLYYGYTFGLRGSIGPALGILVSLAIFGCQVPLSHWWLARFRFGPAEWLWRSLTYGRPQPMRLRPSTAEPTPRAIPAPAGAE